MAPENAEGGGSPSAAVTPSAPPALDPLRWKTLLVVGIVSLMVVLDGTVMNIALPSIQADLGFSDVARQWVVTAYTLAFGGLLLLGGRIGDYAGRKRTLILGLAGFAIASALGGLGGSALLLILARAATGACAALLAPATLSLIAVSFSDDRERTRAFAIYSAIAAGGGALGLVLGGVLTQVASWHWCLFINVGFGAVAIALAVPWVRESRAPGQAHYDIPGAVLGTAGVLAVVYGLAEAGSAGWGSAAALGPLALGIGLVVAFLVVEARSAAPLLPLRIIRDRNRAGAFLGSLLSGASLFATFLFISYYLQAVKGYAPLEAGLLGLPFSAGVVVSTWIAQRLLHRVGPRLLTTAGFALATVGTLGLSRIGVDSVYATDMLPSLLVMSLGMGIIFVPITVVAVDRIDPGDLGVASAVVNMTQQIGGSLGVALLNTVATATTAAFVVTAGGAATDPAALVAGFTAAFAWSAAILLLGGIAWFLLVRVAPPPAEPGTRATAEAAA